MPDPRLEWWDSTDATQSPALAFTPVNGVAAAPQVLHLWNDKGGTSASDDAAELVVTCLTRDQGDTEWSATHAAAAGGWVRVQAVGSGGPGAPVAHLTGLTPIGQSRQLALLDLPSDGYRELEISVLVPAGVGTQALEVKLVARAGGVSEALPDGAYEVGGVGVRSGLGDTECSYLAWGGAVTANGPADNKVDVAELHYVHAGVPLTVAAAEVVLSQSDGVSEALTSGQAYIARLSVGAAGTVTTTKGLRAAAASAAAPALPDGELLVADVTVDYQAGSSVVETADIDQTARRFGGFHAVTSGASLSVTIHPGEALVGGRLVRITGTRNVTLAASDETWVWLSPAGAMVQALTAVAPVDRSLLLYRVTTDGSGVVSMIDCRAWAGRQVHALRAGKAGVLAANDYSGTVVYSGRAPGRIRPVAPLTWALGDNGSTSGLTKLDVEVSEAGGAWTSLYPSSGTTDLRPTIPHDSTDPTSEGTPETGTIQPRSRLRFKVIAVPGTASADLDAVLLVEEAG